MLSMEAHIRALAAFSESVAGGPLVCGAGAVEPASLFLVAAESLSCTRLAVPRVLTAADVVAESLLHPHLPCDVIAPGHVRQILVRLGDDVIAETDTEVSIALALLQRLSDTRATLFSPRNPPESLSVALSRDEAPLAARRRRRCFLASFSVPTDTPALEGGTVDVSVLIGGRHAYGSPHSFSLASNSSLFGSLVPNVTQPVETFDGMHLREDLLRGVYAYCFEKPLPTQGLAIPSLIQGRDAVVVSPSGSGKTAILVIAALAHIDPSIASCQSLILVPTRELAMAECCVLKSIGAFMKVRAHAAVGGVAVRNDAAAVTAGVHVVVGTPGRTYDLIARGLLRLCSLKFLALDEVDGLLDRGFGEQLADIFKSSATGVQIAMFSASTPPEVLDLMAKATRDPAVIVMRSAGADLTLSYVKQYRVDVESDSEAHRLETLRDLLSASTGVSAVMVYCVSQHAADSVAENLARHGYTVATLHATLTGGVVEDTLSRFRAGSLRILVSSMPVPSTLVSRASFLVINFDLPTAFDDYLLRVGSSLRCGRFPAISLVAPGSAEHMASIESQFQTRVDDLPADVAQWFLG